VRQFEGQLGADQVAIAQDGDTVCYSIDFIHPMANEHHGGAMGT
jgi:hypothetical protein